MSDKEALIQFERQQVSSEMVQYLVDVTSSLIKVKQAVYLSPPDSPVEGSSSNSPRLVSLYEFIRRLIKHSNVQTPTLMSTLVYLNRLKTILPSNVYGIETTRHRIFLGCLILAAKFLNDSSPINKHWAKYTDGLLSIQEINTIERELLEYLNWDLIITNEDLINSLDVFIVPIKSKLHAQQQEQIMLRQQQYLKTSSCSKISNSSSTKSIQSTVPSLMSSSSSQSTLASSNYGSSRNINQYIGNDDIAYYTPTKPLKVRSASDNNKRMSMLTKSGKSFNLNAAGTTITGVY